MKTSLPGKIERTPLRERVYVLLQQAIVTGALKSPVFMKLDINTCFAHEQVFLESAEGAIAHPQRT